MLIFSRQRATSLLSISSLILKTFRYLSKIWPGVCSPNFSSVSPTSPVCLAKILNSWLSRINSNLAHSRMNLSSSDLRSSMNPSSLSPKICFSGMQGMKQPGQREVRVTCRMWNSLQRRTTSNFPCESWPVTVYLIVLPNFYGLVTPNKCAEFSSSSKLVALAAVEDSEALLN